jgi:hypothetical protein
MSVPEKPQMENMIDHRVRKNTQRKIYLEYSTKWKGHLMEDVRWESEADIQKHGQMVQKLMEMSP